MPSSRLTLGIGPRGRSITPDQSECRSETLGTVERSRTTKCRKAAVFQFGGAAVSDNNANPGEVPWLGDNKWLCIARPMEGA